MEYSISNDELDIFLVECKEIEEQLNTVILKVNKLTKTQVIKEILKFRYKVDISKIKIRSFDKLKESLW